jgi:hypothetical protein
MPIESKNTGRTVRQRNSYRHASRLGMHAVAAMWLLASCSQGAMPDVSPPPQSSELASAPDTDAGSDESTSSSVCGDGILADAEQCDPSVDGWADHCGETCRRTSYAACDMSSECPGANSNCSAYETTPGTMFCADFCREASSCPVLPGFESRCNFAWCVVLCNDGVCPHGMRCLSGANFLDAQGQSAGTHDVCVVTP